MQRDSGFSLVELMIAIGLAAIIATVAIPAFLSRSADAKLRDAVSMVRGDIELARSRAIRQNANVAVILNAGGYSIFIDDGSGGGNASNWIRDGQEQIVCQRSLTGGIQIDLGHTTFSDHRTRFNGRGYLANSGLFSLKNSSGRTVTVDMNNRFGRVTVN
jgi:type IV fimbrial biogenesis protein FimT